MRFPAARALAVLVALASAAALAGSARAATYTVWSCRGPDGAPVGTGAWQPGTTVAGTTALGSTADTCAKGGSLRAVLLRRATRDNTAYDVSGFRLAVPAGTRIVGYAASIYARTVAARTGGYAAGLAIDDAGAPVGAGAYLGGCVGAGAACTFGAPDPPLAVANGIASSGLPESGAVVAARCDASAGAASARCRPTGTTGPVAQLDLYRSAFDIQDRATPAVGPLSGSLLGGGQAGGDGSVTADVTDAGGGVARTQLLLDGKVTQTEAAGGSCHVPYAVAAPCPGRTHASFDLDGLARGRHTVALLATDAAGNTRRSAARTVTVRTAALRARLRVASALVRLTGRAQQVRGTLRSAGGAPLAGYRISVAQRAVGAATAPFRHALVVRTSARGRFAFPAGSRSRELRLSLASSRLAATPARAVLYAPLRVTVRGPAGTVRNGSTVALTGRLSGAGLGTRGRMVLVQVISDHRWTTVGSVRAGASGALRWVYRFTRSRRPADYRFRFLAPVQPGEPWRAAASGRIVVRVRP